MWIFLTTLWESHHCDSTVCLRHINSSNVCSRLQLCAVAWHQWIQHLYAIGSFPTGGVGIIGTTDQENKVKSAIIKSMGNKMSLYTLPWGSYSVVLLATLDLKKLYLSHFLFCEHALAPPAACHAITAVFVCTDSCKFYESSWRHFCSSHVTKAFVHQDKLKQGDGCTQKKCSEGPAQLFNSSANNNSNTLKKTGYYKCNN